MRHTSTDPLRLFPAQPPVASAVGSLWRYGLLAATSLGAGLGVYLSYLKLTGQISNLAGCGGEGGCADLLGSRWSHWMQLPVSLWALAVYLPLLTLGFLGLTTPARRRLAFVAASILVAAAAWFLVVQAFIEKSFCPYCCTMHGCSLVAWICTARYLLGNDPLENFRTLLIAAPVAAGSVGTLVLGQLWGPQVATHEISQADDLADLQLAAVEPADDARAATTAGDSTASPSAAVTEPSVREPRATEPLGRQPSLPAMAPSGADETREPVVAPAEMPELPTEDADPAPEVLAGRQPVDQDPADQDPATVVEPDPDATELVRTAAATSLPAPATAERTVTAEPAEDLPNFDEPTAAATPDPNVARNGVLPESPSGGTQTSNPPAVPAPVHHAAETPTSPPDDARPADNRVAASRLTVQRPQIADPGPSRMVSYFGGVIQYNAATMPIVGNPTASKILVKYFDYTCPACKRMHDDLDTLLESHPDLFAVLVIPCPLDRSCNPHVKELAAGQTNIHADACELSRMALAVWRSKPETFVRFHDELFDRQGKVTGKAARIMAASLIGEDAVAAADQDPWIHDVIQNGVTIYGKLKDRNPKMPKLLLGDRKILHGVVVDPAAFQRVLLETLGG